MDKGAEFLKRFRALAKWLSRLEEALWLLADDFEAALEGGIDWGDGRKEGGLELAKRLEAVLGVECVEIRRFADESASVIIGDYPPIELSKVLVDLLLVLCCDTGKSPDHLVGWKKPEEIAAMLEKRRRGTSVRPVTRESVIQNVHRLKKAIAKGGGNRFLVHNHRELGYRMALRRSPGPAIPCNPE